jgi:hypothetical protein
MSGVESMHPWTFYALEVSRDRERDHQLRRLVSQGRVDRPDRRSRVRRPAALILAALSRVAAGAVRRLDDCVADDLGRSLSPTK